MGGIHYVERKRVCKNEGRQICRKVKSYEGYGMDKKQKVWTDEAGNKFYPGVSHPTIVLVDGKIL